MRVAALYDIHGNLPAVEAVVDEVETLKVDLIVVGGDVLPGPMPCETLNYLLELGPKVRFISGNGEAAVLAELQGRGATYLPEQARQAVRWTAQQLSPEHQAEISGWPGALSVEIGGVGEVLFCHATPRSDTEIFTRLTPEEHLRPMFEDVRASLVVCGHTHMQFDRIIGGVRVVNAGSVGMPFGKPGADWLLLGPDVQLRHTKYDLERCAQRIRQTSYPQAEEFAKGNVLHPPSEEAMVELFTKSGIKARE